MPPEAMGTEGNPKKEKCGRSGGHAWPPLLSASSQLEHPDVTATGKREAQVLERAHYGV